MVNSYILKFALGLGSLGLLASVASAHPHPEKVTIISGTETSANTQISRTSLRIRTRNGRLIFTERFTDLTGNSELNGGPGMTRSTSTRRASTGRSRETTSKGVRIINKR